jgi:hypothetical protein
VHYDRQLAALGRKPGRELVRLSHQQVRPHVAGEAEQVGQHRRRELGEHAELPGAAGCLEARQERLGVGLVPGRPDRREVQLRRLDFCAQRLSAGDKDRVARVLEGVQGWHERE